MTTVDKIPIREGRYLCKCGIPIKYDKQGNNRKCRKCGTFTHELLKKCPCGKSFCSTRNMCKRCLTRNGISIMKIHCGCGLEYSCYSDQAGSTHCVDCQTSPLQYTKNCSACKSVQWNCRIVKDSVGDETWFCKSCYSKLLHRNSCIACHRGFEHKLTKGICDSCTNEKTNCKSCGTQFTIPYEARIDSVHSPDRTLLKTYCSTCLNKCKLCNSTADQTLPSPCFLCQKIRRTVTDESWGEKTDISHLITTKKVTVTYTMETEEHDGYCSDPGEIETVENSETKTYPLLNIFDDTDFMEEDDGARVIRLDSPKSFYYTQPAHSSCMGYCGCETTYKIEQIEVL